MILSEPSELCHVLNKKLWKSLRAKENFPNLVLSSVHADGLAPFATATAMA